MLTKGLSLLAWGHGFYLSIHWTRKLDDHCASWKDRDGHSVHTRLKGQTIRDLSRFSELGHIY